MDIPKPSRERLVQLIRILDNCENEFVSSAELEAKSGWPSNTIRKDISCIGNNSTHSRGYGVKTLRETISKRLGLDITRNFCIIGLGRLGSAFLNYGGFERDGFTLVAGFDSSVNRIEVLSSPVPLYPAFKMPELITRRSIEMALLCVPADSAQKVCSSIITAGVRAIINFAPIILEVPKAVSVRNVYVVDELRALSAALYANDASNDPLDRN